MAEIPTTRLYKAGEEAVVNTSDMPAYLAQGWLTEAPAPPMPPTTSAEGKTSKKGGGK